MHHPTDKNCGVFCQTVTFSQNVCLVGGGGSIIAECTPQGLKQTMFETTSCFGPSKVNYAQTGVCEKTKGRRLHSE